MNTVEDIMKKYGREATRLALEDLDKNKDKPLIKEEFEKLCKKHCEIL